MELAPEIHHIRKDHLTMAKKTAFIRDEMRPQILSLTFFRKSGPLLSATSNPFCSNIAYNTTASLDKLTYTDYVDFGKCQDNFEPSFWSKKVSKYLVVKLKVLKIDDDKKFRLIQNLTTGEAAFNQFMRLRNHQVIAAESIGREENLSSVMIPTMSKDKSHFFIMTHKMVDVMDLANRKVCMTLLRYNLDKPEFLCQSSIVCKEKKGRAVLTNCLC